MALFLTCSPQVSKFLDATEKKTHTHSEQLICILNIQILTNLTFTLTELFHMPRWVAEGSSGGWMWKTGEKTRGWKQARKSHATCTLCDTRACTLVDGVRSVALMCSVPFWRLKACCVRLFRCSELSRVAMHFSPAFAHEQQKRHQSNIQQQQMWTNDC